MRLFSGDLSDVSMLQTDWGGMRETYLIDLCHGICRGRLGRLIDLAWSRCSSSDW